MKKFEKIHYRNIKFFSNRLNLNKNKLKDLTLKKLIPTTPQYFLPPLK